MCAFPSTEQDHVIAHRGRPLVVVAAPGTGKTRTIVERMIRLVGEDRERVVSFVTFTRASRRDTDRKLRETVGQKAAEFTEEHFPRISTLHRFAKAVVHRYSQAGGREATFSVLAPRQHEKDILISEVIEDLDLAVGLKSLEEAITRFRSTGDWPADPALAARRRVEIVDRFELLLGFYNTFDMEGLVLAACEFLAERPGDLPPVFLQVDEYQDLNPRDQRLVGLVSGAQGSQVVVVGDDAQSIYGIRYAYPAGIRELWASEDWEKECFPECHRLPAHILRAAQHLIKDRGYLGGRAAVPEDDGRRLLTFRCTQRTRGSMPPVQVEAVARYIDSVVDTRKRADGSPVGFKDLMVLCPTNNQVDQVASALSDTYAIPTRRPKTGAIPDDVWKLLLVLRMVGSADSLALRQWLAVAGLSPLEIRQTRTAAMKAGKSLYEYCQCVADSRVTNIFLSVASVSQAVADALEFRQALITFPCLPVTTDVTAIIDDMVIASFPAIGRMIGYAYEKYGLIDVEEDSDDIAEEDKVLVTTMHKAKGLEAEFVFIMWLNSRFMPFPGRDRDEEERVFYVALTRARQDVILTFQEEWDERRRRLLGEEAMSPFLRSIRDHLQITRVTAPMLRS